MGMRVPVSGVGAFEFGLERALRRIFPTRGVVSATGGADGCHHFGRESEADVDLRLPDRRTTALFLGGVRRGKDLAERPRPAEVLVIPF